MGWQNDIFQVLIVEAGQTRSGLFVYSGLPASGNLIASVAAATGTDEFGNSYQDGIVSYVSSSDYVKLRGDRIGFVGGGSNASINLTADGLLFGGISPLQRYYFDKDIAAVDPTTGNTAETWHSINGSGHTGATGWTVNHGRYRKAEDGCVEWDFNVYGGPGGDGSVAGSAGTITFTDTLGPDYQPAMDRIYPLGTNSTGATAFAHITTAGAVTLIVPAVAKLGASFHMRLD